MTANVFREDIEKVMLAGMDAHIGKPIDPDDLMRKLRKYIGHKSLTTKKPLGSGFFCGLLND